METLVYFIYIAVASFAVLAQPAVAQGANTNLSLTYPGQVLQGDSSQICPSTLHADHLLPRERKMWFLVVTI